MAVRHSHTHILGVRVCVRAMHGVRKANHFPSRRQNICFIFCIRYPFLVLFEHASVQKRCKRMAATSLLGCGWLACLRRSPPGRHRSEAGLVARLELSCKTSQVDTHSFHSAHVFLCHPRRHSGGSRGGWLRTWVPEFGDCVGAKIQDVAWGFLSQW